MPVKVVKWMMHAGKNNPSKDGEANNNRLDDARTKWNEMKFEINEMK